MSLDSFKYKKSKFAYKFKSGFSNLTSLFLKLVGKKKDGVAHVIKQADFDKKLVYSLSKSRIPTLRQLKYIKTYLNRRELLVMRSCALLVLVCLIFLGARFYTRHLSNVPVVGGNYTEGVVGFPKYINPLYSSASDVDSDLTQLVYSSLFKRDVNGFLAKDLVESYQSSPDGKTYTLHLRPDVRWQNGSQLTADDVVFTFNAIKDSQYKSPLRLSFSGVKIEESDKQTVRFILSEPYAAFYELLTFGILPQEQWYQIPPAGASLAGLNLKPIGSGPYEVKSYSKDSKTGSIKSYSLAINSHYYGGKPKIKDLIFKFYPNYEELIADLNNNAVDGISYLPTQFKKEAGNKTYLNYYKLNLPQLMAIFFNTKTNPILADQKVRQALAYSINKTELVDKVFSGDARTIDSPILPDSFAYDQAVKKYSFSSDQANSLLDQAGWKVFSITAAELNKAKADKSYKNEVNKLDAETILAMGEGNWRIKDGKLLVIKLTTVDTSENQAVIGQIQYYWQKIGVKTAIELVASNKIQSSVIRPRTYEALFYGEVVGADPDPYLFWHSSQANSDGSNIANYSNKEVDKLLEDARTTIDLNKRKGLYKKFQEIIAEEEPAVFMYSPVYTYVQDKKVQNFNTKSIINPSDRLADVVNWYIAVGKKVVW